MDNKVYKSRGATMKKINVKFIGRTGYDVIGRHLEKKYELSEVEKPDFAVFTCDTRQECFKYDCVRILVMGENERPDFNLFDYAVGFDKIDFSDRYLYYPLYCWNIYTDKMERALSKHLYADDYYLTKQKFCNFIVSNGANANKIRDNMFDELSKVKKVDSAGRYRNNMADGKPIPYNKTTNFQEQYKFTIAFENSSYKGYTTEKIFQAWAAGTIPIYWGDPCITEQFNQDAFINCHNFASLSEMIDYVKRVDCDDELYLRIQKTPILKEDSIVPIIRGEHYLMDFLSHIFDQEPEVALRRTNYKDGWGAFYERDAKRHYELDHSRLVSIAYKLSRILHGTNEIK